MNPNPRRLIIRALARLERSNSGASQQILREILDGPDARTMDPRDRSLVTECFYGVLRWRLQLDSVIGQYAKRGVPKDPEVANLLRLGAFQLLHLDRVPARAAVHSTVKMARKLRGESISRFVNGVLRQIDREPPSFSELSKKWAHPQWIVDCFERELNDPTLLEARLRANMTPPPLTLRLHPNAPQEAKDSVNMGENLTVLAPSNYQKVREGIQQNWWLPQDEASAKVVHLLNPKPGDRVLEICAGRGVKSSQIATAIGSNGLLLAIDNSAARLASSRRLLSRWAPDTPHHMVAANATNTLPIDSDLRFDRILIDAPCSGLGVIRRRPEILFSRQADDVAKNARVQKAMLATAQSWLKPDGVIVYAVCTTTQEETTEVTQGYSIIDHFESRPERDQIDGFYAAMLAL